jgi:hypothetical protein
MIFHNKLILIKIKTQMNNIFKTLTKLKNIWKFLKLF